MIILAKCRLLMMVISLVSNAVVPRFLKPGCLTHTQRCWRPKITGTEKTSKKMVDEQRPDGQW